MHAAATPTLTSKRMCHPCACGNACTTAGERMATAHADQSLHAISVCTKPASTHRVSALHMRPSVSVVCARTKGWAGAVIEQVAFLPPSLWGQCRVHSTPFRIEIVAHAHLQIPM